MNEATSLMIIVTMRHGEVRSDELTEEGLERVTDTVKQLKALLPEGKKIRLFSSPADRATQSADILEQEFGVQNNVLKILYKDGYGDGEKQMAELLENTADAEILIVVTHHQAPSGIINAFSKKFGGRGLALMEIGKGSAFVLNLQTDERKFIS